VAALDTARLPDTTASAPELAAFLDGLTVGDCREVLPALPPECVDMVFLDPPYYLQLPRKLLLRWGVRTAVESPEREWDRFASFAEYDAFMGQVLQACRRVMRPSATIWVIGTYHNIFRLGTLLQDLGFWILNDVIWFKTNAMPNWLNVRLTNATETLIWAARDRQARGYVFDAAAAREYSRLDFGARIGLNLWRLPLCSGRERLKRSDGKRLHPTQKPERLLERILRVSTAPGQVVLDPMAGTGTTGVVAQRLGRHFILIERDPVYAHAARARLAAASAQLLAASAAPAAGQPP
jgi:DNA modification methylase